MNSNSQQVASGRAEQETQSAEQPTTERHSCPECECEVVSVDLSMGEVVCDDCGLVLEENQFEKEPKWGAVNDSEHQSEVIAGAENSGTINDDGLATNIDFRDRDGYGKPLSSLKRTQMHRLRTWQRELQTQDQSEPNYNYALNEIDRMAAALSIPRSVREYASEIYKDCLQEDLIRGYSIEGVATAALIATCRAENIPRTLAEISEVSRAEESEIGHTHRYIAHELDLNNQSVTPSAYVPLICSNLGLSETVRERAEIIIELTESVGLIGSESAISYAAAAVYGASVITNEKTTQANIANVTNLTQSDIRERYQNQIEAIGL
jgi:transcription initiation factor TFIIB